MVMIKIIVTLTIILILIFADENDSNSITRLEQKLHDLDSQYQIIIKQLVNKAGTRTK